MKARAALVIYTLLFMFQLCAKPSVQNMHVCTVASHDKKELQQLLHSCRDNGIKLDILGFGKPFKGMGQKLSYVKEYLDQFPDEDIVLFIDAYDVLFLASAQTILDTFLSKNVSCIFAAELYKANSWPLHYLSRFYSPSPTAFQYINSGTYMGYVGYLKKFFNGFQISDEDDQSQIALYYIYHQNEIALDYYCELFFPLVWLTDQHFTVNIENKNICCLITNTNPCIVHGNGGNEKIYYQSIYDLLYSKPITGNK